MISENEEDTNHNLCLGYLPGLQLRRKSLFLAVGVIKNCESQTLNWSEQTFYILAIFLSLWSDLSLPVTSVGVGPNLYFCGSHTDWR